jgi:1-deoxy-D-xylulose-5-phosphate reductoisomerase
MTSPIKSINILGATGSIGQCTADVIASDSARFDVCAVTANTNAEDLAKIAIRLKAKKAILASSEKFSELKQLLSGTGIEAGAGSDALEEACAYDVDLTLAAIVGMAGLRPLMQSIKHSKCVAIANKEPLVAAGPLVMAEARKHGTKILPVDSEHNAVFQVFDFENPEGIEKIILTASGGPFLTATPDAIRNATPKQALAHPNWSMGQKISIDSATMMNKVLEVIEAHYLFGLAPENIEIIIHPQSVVHSMVEYKDGSILAQMGASDMRTPIAHVLAWPERMKTPGQRLDLKALKNLTFETPDRKRFPAIDLAYTALNTGPAACITLNAANEVAVEAFLQGKTGFLGIVECICNIMEETPLAPVSTLAEIENLDKSVRQAARAYISEGNKPKTAVAR